MTEPSLPAPRRLADRVEWRLSAHFFRAMFDFGVLSEAGADSLKHLFIGSIGGFVSAAWLMVVIYADKYLVLWFQPSPEPYRRALLGDDMFMLGVPMLVGAFVTLLVSSSLFPDERDFRILGPLPIHRGVVFGAKMAALVLFVGAFIALTDASLLPLFLLTTRNPWGEHVFVGRLAAWLATSAAASAFAILAAAAGVGLLGLLRSSARLQGVTTTAKSLALGLLVLSVPLVVRLSDLGGALADRSPWFLLVPPAWFVGLERVMAGSRDPAFVRLAAIALTALAGAAVAVGGLYTLLFRHFERLVLRPPITSPAGQDSALRRRQGGSPAYLAVGLFTVATLRRGALHQGVLVGLAACGFGLAANSLMGDEWKAAALWTPFTLMFACGIGVRSSLVLPVEHRANWIFRITEDDATRADQLRAMNDVATVCVAVPAVAASLPRAVGSTGPEGRDRGRGGGHRGPAVRSRGPARLAADSVHLLVPARQTVRGPELLRRVRRLHRLRAGRRMAAPDRGDEHRECPGHRRRRSRTGVRAPAAAARRLGEAAADVRGRVPRRADGARAQAVGARRSSRRRRTPPRHPPALRRQRPASTTRPPPSAPDRAARRAAGAWCRSAGVDAGRPLPRHG